MILDTNVYSALRLDKQEAVDLVRYAGDIVFPLPVIAELHYGFRLGTRTKENEKILQEFLSQSIVSVLSPTPKTAQYYADLAVWCRKRGRAPCHNDLWIAALAQESNQQLVTYDKDFEVFADLFGDKLIILSNS